MQYLRLFRKSTYGLTATCIVLALLELTAKINARIKFHKQTEIGKQLGLFGLMDYAEVKKRIQHFLLQQDEGYRESIQNNIPAPSIAKIAKSLDKKCSIGQRRLQKYLSDTDNEKELSINLSDLDTFAKLVDMKPGQFLSYLLEEDSLSPQLSPWKSNLIEFFGNIHHSLRRELNCTVFSGEDIERREKLLDLLLLMDKTNSADFSVINRIVAAIVNDSQTSSHLRK
ncbi:MAG: hypothetical protein AB8G05_01060 [Oligoflexales bacterium]